VIKHEKHEQVYISLENITIPCDKSLTYHGMLRLTKCLINNKVSMLILGKTNLNFKDCLLEDGTTQNATFSLSSFRVCWNARIKDVG
jgi:hypothetical protein